jgi:5'-deoxynucleotidase YfbR-like HD superfamily hydrolase
MAQKSEASSCVHDELGYYTCPLDTTDTGTIGKLRLMVHETGALPVWEDFHILAANVYDSIFGAASDKLQVDTVEVSGTGQTANDNGADINAILADTDELQTDDIPAAIAALPTAVENRTEMDSNSTQLAAIVADTNELQTDDIPTTLATIAGYLDTEINAILADTNELQLDWMNGGRLDLIIDAILADTDELQGDDIPTLIAALPTAVENRTEMDSNSTQLAAIVADTNELQSDDIPTSIAALPTAVEIQAEMEENGASMLDSLRDGLTDQRMANLDELGAANLPSDIDAILADTNELQVDDVPGLIAALNNLSVADVWTATEDITGDAHTYKSILARLYSHMNNEMNITDATGYMELRNAADSAEMANCTITDNATTTQRTELTWA